VIQQLFISQWGWGGSSVFCSVCVTVSLIYITDLRRRNTHTHTERTHVVASVNNWIISLFVWENTCSDRSLNRPLTRSDVMQQLNMPRHGGGVTSCAARLARWLVGELEARRARTQHFLREKKIIILTFYDELFSHRHHVITTHFSRCHHFKHFISVNEWRCSWSVGHLKWREKSETWFISVLLEEPLREPSKSSKAWKDAETYGEMRHDCH